MQGVQKSGVHYGTESREMLPLWKRAGCKRSAGEAIEVVGMRCAYRNGTESRELLPLR